MVKAFDTMSEAYMDRLRANPPSTPPDEALTIFYCGDNRDAKKTFSDLIEDTGFAA